MQAVIYFALLAQFPVMLAGTGQLLREIWRNLKGNSDRYS